MKRRSRLWTSLAVLGSIAVGALTRPALLRMGQNLPRFVYLCAPLPAGAYDALASVLVLPALQAVYGPSLYFRLAVPGGTYPGLTSDVGVVAVANVLVVDERMSDDLAYDLTRVLFDKQRDLAAIHPEGAKLTLETAIEGSPAPYHPGAIRYYRERGVWTR